MEEYARLFIDAGYDLPTVTRMTPEDLTAVGIKKPNHRKRLKAELANLNVPDNLPDYIPVGGTWNFAMLMMQVAMLGMQFFELRSLQVLG